MRTARSLAQKMKYSNRDRKVPIYEYYTDSEGNKHQIETGRTEIVYAEPVDFTANINNKLDEVLIKEFGIDNSTNFAQIVTAKGAVPLQSGSIIWKQSEVQYGGIDKTIVDDSSADYIVMGVADEGINFDLFLLQRKVKKGKEIGNDNDSEPVFPEEH